MILARDIKVGDNLHIEGDTYKVVDITSGTDCLTRLIENVIGLQGSFTTTYDALVQVQKYTHRPTA